jgi:hypothetical protein
VRRAATHRVRTLVAATCGFAAYTAVMVQLDRRMCRSGGPGIIPFELAGNVTGAEQIMSRWGREGQRAARVSLWLDFGYMLTYGTLTALLLDQVRRLRGHPWVVPAVIIPAVAADAVEGVSLLKVLNRANVTANAGRARKAAMVKFTILGGALTYCAVGAVSTAVDRRR